MNVSKATLEGAFVDELELLQPTPGYMRLVKDRMLQQLFFPEGVAFDGNRFNRTAARAPLFNYLAPFESADEKVVTLTFASWNQIAAGLR